MSIPSVEVSYFCDSIFSGAIGSTTGRRYSNEDTHDIQLALNNHPGVAFFGIFDGHGGKQASEYVKSNLSKRISQIEDITHDSIVSAFEDIDEKFIGHGEKTEAGSCAVIALVKSVEKGFSITICNLGDSRAILLSKKSNTSPFTNLTNDHKPDVPDEKKRIEAAGGFVSAFGGVPRVNGSLAVSRAFGDRSFKVGRFLNKDKAVIVIPEIMDVEASVGDYLLLACDGIFEPISCTSEWVANYVIQQLEKTNDIQQTVKNLIETVFQAGSNDNITAMLIKLASESDKIEKEKRELKDPLAFDDNSSTTVSTPSDSEGEEEVVNLTSSKVKEKEVIKSTPAKKKNPNTYTGIKRRRNDRENNSLKKKRIAKKKKNKVTGKGKIKEVQKE